MPVFSTYALKKNATDFDRKPVLVFGSPRSGSTLLYRIVSGYLEQTEGTRELDEYFNLDWTNFRSRWGKIVPCPKDANIHNGISAAEYKKQIEQRFLWLKNGNGKYSLKALGGYLPKDQIDWFANNYNWIFIERKNLFEQLLSYMISRITKQWYVEGGIKVPRASLHGTHDLVSQFEGRILEYQSMKTRLQPTNVVYYEDLSQNLNPIKILSNLGYIKPIDINRLKLPERQNSTSKHELFCNVEEIASFYRKTELNQLFSI